MEMTITVPSRLNVCGGFGFPGNRSSGTEAGALPASSTSVSSRMYWWWRYLSMKDTLGGGRNALSSRASMISMAHLQTSKSSAEETHQPFPKFKLNAHILYLLWLVSNANTQVHAAPKTRFGVHMTTLLSKSNGSPLWMVGGKIFYNLEWK